MPPKSDAQKQIDRERLLETLKGFAKGSLNIPMDFINYSNDPALTGASNIINILGTLAAGWADEPTGDGSWDREYVHENPRKVMRNIQLATRLPGAIHGAYKAYKESSPFNKKEDKQLKEVFGDKLSKSSDGSYIPNLPNIESDAIPSKNAFSSAGYQAMPGSESLKEFFNKLKESGYEVPA